MFVSNPFASASCRGRKAQMQSEYAQPAAGVKAWEGAGWAPREVRGAHPLWASFSCVHSLKGPAWWPQSQRVTALLMRQEEPSPGVHRSD